MIDVMYTNSALQGISSNCYQAGVDNTNKIQIVIPLTPINQI